VAPFTAGLVINPIRKVPESMVVTTGRYLRRESVQLRGLHLALISD